MKLLTINNNEVNLMLKRIKAFLKEETGAETLEYVAIAAVIIIVGAGAYQAAGINDVITNGIAAIAAVIPAG